MHPNTFEPQAIEPSGLGGGAGRAVQELARQDLQRCFYPVLLLAAHPGHDLTDGLRDGALGPLGAIVVPGLGRDADQGPAAVSGIGGR